MFTRHFTSIGLIVAQLLLSPACHAADWYEVGGFPDKGVKVYVDESSLVVDHDTVVTGWIRFEYKTPREWDGKQLIGQSSLRMANCGDRRYWVSEAWGYPLNNTEPVRLYGDAQEWQLAAPDSEARIALDALCFEAQSLFGILWDKAGTGLSRIRHGGMSSGQ